MFNFLQVDLTWHVGDSLIFLPIIITLISFSAFWFISKSDKIRNKFYLKHDPDQASVKHILFTKYSGLFLMGIIPAILITQVLPQFNLRDYGIVFIPETALTSLAWIIGLSLIIVPLAVKSARKPKNLVNYPQIRVKIWNRGIIFNYAIGWAAYLLGYEFLFRGILLMPLVKTIGVWPAITVNIAVYSATHIPKGLDETIGAAVLGMILCVLTISTGTIWIAFFVHVALAWTNSYTALKNNPEMKIVKI